METKEPNNIFRQKYGVDVYIDDSLCIGKKWKQFRFPKSKKRRIKIKWAKRDSSYKIKEVHTAIRIGRTMYVSRLMYEKLKQLPTIEQ